MRITQQAGRQGCPVMTECLPGVDDDGVIVEQPQRRTGVTELLRAWQPVSGKPQDSQVSSPWLDVGWCGSSARSVGLLPYMCGSDVALSETPSMSKNTAPLMCSSKYSCSQK